MLKLASWNVNSLRVRLPQVLDWLAQQKADILALQETKLTNEDFPLDEIGDVGYHALFSGQKTYNGVAILSKFKPQQHTVQTDIPALDDPQRRILAATYNDIRFINIYVPNGAAVGSEKFFYKLDWLEKFTLYLKQQQQQYEKIVVAGDFNIAPEDRDVHDPVAWRGSVLVSEPERAALANIIELGFVDSFRLFEQEPEVYSWWDYRAAGFRRNHGLRIDLMLVSEALADNCTSATIDKIPRGWERPSDHAPVLAEFET